MKIASAWSGHDCSFCILQDGSPVVHAEYERYIREKEPAGDSIQFLFDEYEDHHDIKHFATNHLFRKMDNYPESLQRMKNLIEKNDGQIHVLGHHQSHAANAFFSSNFDNALIFTMDGGGVENESGFITAFTVWKGDCNKIEPLAILPISDVNIGGVWTRATRYIFKLQSGWPNGHQAGTVMAMAAMGDPDKYVRDFYTMLSVDSAIASLRPPGQPKGCYSGADPRHPYLGRWTDLADSGAQERFDIAAGLQRATEVYLKNLLSPYVNSSNSENICFAGGVSLNSVAMGKILDWFPDKNLYVTPTPHDGGLTLGAAQYVHHQILDNPRIKWEDNFTPYLGSTTGITEEAVALAISECDEEIVANTATNQEVVDLLADGKIVAVFGGGSESGRRALGNRSILADPRDPEMKDTINEKVKHRQWFRPFAPSVLREAVNEWFTVDQESPYMSFVLSFREEKKEKVPAVVHLDGTARLQTVTRNDNQWYYDFLKQWQERSGVPILLNTSFNDREPICETPDHAINCFLRTEIDYLFFYEHSLLVRRKEE